MIHIHSISLLFILTFSLWSFFIFAFQSLIFRFKSMDKKMIYSSVYVFLVFLLYTLASLYYIENSPINDFVFKIISGFGVSFCLIFLYLFDGNRFSKKLNRVRMLVYIAGFLICISLTLALTLTMRFSLHIYFGVFLLTELTLLMIFRQTEHNRLFDNVLYPIGIVMLIGANIFDFFLSRSAFDIRRRSNFLHSAVLFFQPLSVCARFDSGRDSRFGSAFAKGAGESISSSISMIVHLLESKNEYLRGHSEKVSFYATLIGNRLGLPLDELEELQTTAMLHDIGYIGVAIEEYSHKAVINKDDFEKVKMHPIIGSEILRKSSYFSKYADFVLMHHEYWDGTGYPFGIRGKDIPLFARIIQVADTFDALTTDRFYRTKISREDALMIMKFGKGQEFDPDLVDIFLSCLVLEK